MEGQGDVDHASVEQGHTCVGSAIGSCAAILRTGEASLRRNRFWLTVVLDAGRPGKVMWISINLDLFCCLFSCGSSVESKVMAIY